MNDTWLERCHTRRARALAALGEHAALVLPAAPELHVGRDVELRYQVDPELYYLTGYTEPDAVAVLAPGADTPFTMFVRPRDAAAELWTGPREEPDAARERLAADAVFPIGELAQRLPGLVAGADTLLFRLGSGRREVEQVVTDILAAQRRGRQRKGKGPHELRDPGALLDDMRLVKDDAEIERLREAARLSVDGFRAAARAIRPGAGEWEVEAAAEAAFRSGGGQMPAFPTIAASGPNATVLHYIDNTRRMQAGDLLLLDAGARSGMYCGDISRTFPVSGRFSAEQHTLYDLVLAAHDAAIALARPGATEADLHAAAVHTLVAGLVDLGLLDGDVDEIAADKERYARFYPHRTCHWLGLEVHDVGDYGIGDVPRPLVPGMALTVEPGLYIPATLDLPPHLTAFRGLGIRIEDDLLITPDGCAILTAALPANPSDIEALVRN